MRSNCICSTFYPNRVSKEIRVIQERVADLVTIKRMETAVPQVPLELPVLRACQVSEERLEYRVYRLVLFSNLHEYARD